MKKYFFWTKALSLEGFIFLFSLFFILFRKVNLNWKRKVYKKCKPVLLIHGYLHNSFIWLYHGKKLKEKGLGPVYTINLKSPFSSIETQAFEIKEKVLSIQKENNTSDLVLIGHSMGGLAASYYALNFADDCVTDIISIATPYNGTAMANFGIGKCGKEMKENSSFIKELRKKIETAKNINFYYIATKTDQLVRPYDSALMGKNSERQYILNGIGHASLLFSKKVNNQISKWLSS